MMTKDERYYSAYLSHHNISRRGLFRLFKQSPQQQSLRRLQNRPPFAAKEELFTAFCDGCGKCAQVCPYGLIQIEQQKVTLAITYAACDFCGLCAQACPTKALHPAFKADTELRPHFLAECLQQQGQACDSCIQSCPTKAIRLDSNKQLMVDLSHCNGCGECKVSCFMSAIELTLMK